MIRVRIAAGILAAWMVWSMGAVVLVRRSCDRVLEALDTLEAQPQPEACAQVLDEWQQAEPLLLLIVSREKLVEAEGTLCRLEPLLAADCDEFTAELAAARMLLRHLADEETPYLSSIL